MELEAPDATPEEVPEQLHASREVLLVEADQTPGDEVARDLEIVDLVLGIGSGVPGSGGSRAPHVPERPELLPQIEGQARPRRAGASSRGLGREDSFQARLQHFHARRLDLGQVAPLPRIVLEVVELRARRLDVLPLPLPDRAQVAPPVMQTWLQRLGVGHRRGRRLLPLQRRYQALAGEGGSCRGWHTDQLQKRREQVDGANGDGNAPAGHHAGSAEKQRHRQGGLVDEESVSHLPGALPTPRHGRP